MRHVAAFLLASLLTAGAARAEPAHGFMVQAQLQNDLVIAPGLTTFVGNFSLMPIIRLGWSGWRLSAALEASYSTYATSSSGNDVGLHVIAVGPVIQPVAWRSRDGSARLAAVLGANVGGAIVTSSSGSSSNESVVVGGFNAGLAGHFFPHPNFAAGLEVGVRVQFVNESGSGSSTLLSFASLYAALSLMFVAGS